MEFIDLKTQYQILKEDIEKRINTVLQHGLYIMGPEVAELEQKLSEFVGVKHTIAVSSGTDALLIALLALGIKPGDEVITSAFSFIASAVVVSRLGATPVFADINHKTYNIEPILIENAISEKTKAIIGVDLYGQCADYDAINKIAQKYSLPVIEDGAQSFGASYKGKKALGLTTIGCTSFFPTKPLGCYGDGGACFTNNDELALMMQQIRVHGAKSRYHHVRAGINGRLDTLQAAILLAKLTLFDDEVKKRKQIGHYYQTLLENHFNMQKIEKFNESVFSQMTIEVDERALFQQKIATFNIPTMVHYPQILPAQPVFHDLSLSKQDYPCAIYAAHRVLSLPMSPYLTKIEIENIVDALIESKQFVTHQLVRQKTPCAALLA